LLGPPLGAQPRVQRGRPPRLAEHTQLIGDRDYHFLGRGPGWGRFRKNGAWPRPGSEVTLQQQTQNKYSLPGAQLTQSHPDVSCSPPHVFSPSADQLHDAHSIYHPPKAMMDLMAEPYSTSSKSWIHVIPHHDFVSRAPTRAINIKRM